jgi:hypothetical protein
MLRFGFALIVIVALCTSAYAVSKEDEDATEKRLKAGDRDPAFLLRVNNAVRAGMEWLIKQQCDDGSFRTNHSGEYPGGSTALALLALLKSGLPRSDEVITKGFSFLRKQPLRKTYSVSIAIMALEALFTPQKVEDRQKGHTRAVAPGRMKMPPRDLDWMKELAVFLFENMAYSKMQTQNGVITTPKNAWSYPRDQSGDHSNTQYAILGLRSAQRCGVLIPRGLWEDVWVKVIDHFLEVQEKDGPKVKRWKMLEDRKHGYVSYKTATGIPDTARGWCYSSGCDAKAGGKIHSDATSGSMTCVGIASLLIAVDGLHQIRSAKLNSNRKSAIRKSTNDGLAWMAHHFTVKRNPGHPQGSWLYYYLYGMERAAVLADVRNIGKHDWYREGAEWLIGHQGGGGWSARSGSGPLPATCFALLFLTKATIPGRVKITR